MLFRSPTMYPFCLIGNDYTQGIGFGFRTYIPCYELEDLKLRLFWLLDKNRKEENEPIIEPKSNCKITASTVDLKQLLTTGKAKIEVEGRISVDIKNCRVAVHSWPPGRRFESILSKALIKKQLDNVDIGFIDSSSGKNGTSIIFSVLKTRNRDKIFNIFLKNIKAALKGSISFESITCDSQSNVRLTSVDEMLLNTHAQYTVANYEMFRSIIQKNLDVIGELEKLEKIKQPLQKVLKQGNLLKNNYNSKIKIISQDSKVSEEDVKIILAKYRIQRLFTVGTDTGDLTRSNIELQHNLTNLDTFVLERYKTM